MNTPTASITTEYILLKRIFRKSLQNPVWIIDSGIPGPILLVTAAQHGNEIQGSAAIYRFINEFADTVVSGKIILIPFCNLPAIRKHRPHLHMKACCPYGDDRGHNMNRQWGNEKDKNSTSRLATAIFNAYGQDVKYVLDIHCWQKNKAPAILLHALPGHRKVAAQLGVQFIEMRPVSVKTLAGRIGTDGGIGITYECSGQYEINHKQVSLALNVIRNMAFIAGVSNHSSDTKKEKTIFSDESTLYTVSATCPGLFIHNTTLLPGMKVAKEQVLGIILKEDTLESIPILSPATGYLCRYGVSRPNCDVDIASFHAFVQKRNILAEIRSILPE